MKKIVYRWYWAWNFDKEENWLNEMAAKGLALTSVSFCRYVFEDCTPGEYTVRLQFLNHWSRHPESEAYSAFVEETGAEYIGSVNRWVYFRKKTEEDTFELFDHATMIEHLSSLQVLFGILFFVNFYNGCLNTLYYFEWHHTANLIGTLALFLSFLLGFGFLRIQRMKRKLKKELILFE